MDDSYLRERGSDIEDIGKRVLRKLLGYEGSKTKQFSCQDKSETLGLGEIP